MKNIFAIIIMFLITSCSSNIVSDAVADGAVADVKEINKIVERIEKQTKEECKTEALISNLESLKSQTTSISSQIKNIKQACATEKKVLEQKIITRNIIILFATIVVVFLLYILIRRFK